MGVLPTDSLARKCIPLARGLLDYFPAALAAVAEVSRVGNDKHNPGEPMHHARGKSMDHADCILRHLVDRGERDPEDGVLHSAKVAWRALALLQEEMEAAGAPMARGARQDPREPRGRCDPLGKEAVTHLCSSYHPVYGTTCTLPSGHRTWHHGAEGGCWS